MKNIELKLVTFFALIGLGVALLSTASNSEIKYANSAELYEMVEPFSTGSLISYSSLEASPNES